MAPYGACKSYKAEFEQVFVFFRFCVFVLLSKRDRGATTWPSREVVFEQTRAGCNDMAFERGCV